MKQFFTAVLVVLYCIAEAQPPGFSGHAYYALDAGITQFRPWQENKNGFVIARNNQLLTYGISVNCPAGGRYREYSDANFSFHLFYADRIEPFEDSTSMSARGWELMTSLFAWDLLRHDNFDLVVGPGIYWGKLSLISRPNNAELNFRYANGFIAPMARVDFRYCFGMLVFGTRCSYRFDLTKGDWKRSHASLTPLPSYRFRDLQYLFYIGINVRSKK